MNFSTEPHYFFTTPSVPGAATINDQGHIHFSAFVILTSAQAACIRAVQLWTNLLDWKLGREWASLDLNETTNYFFDPLQPESLHSGSQQGPSELELVKKYYTLSVKVEKRKWSPGISPQYTFRVIYKRAHHPYERWWSSKPGHNGYITFHTRLFCHTRSRSTSLTPSSPRSPSSSPYRRGSFWGPKSIIAPSNYHISSKTACYSSKKWYHWNITNVLFFLALVKKNQSFLEPQVGDSIRVLQGRLIFLLLCQRKDGQYLLFFPFFPKESQTSCYLFVDDNGHLGVKAEGNSKPRNGDLNLGVCTGFDPLLLFREATLQMNRGNQPPVSFKANCSSKCKSILQKLGFCTWNAFYENLNKNVILSGASYFKKWDLHLGYWLIDDGWQNISQQGRLCSFAMNPNKFGISMKHLVSELKSILPSLDAVGVWLTLQGYWKGVLPKFAHSLGLHTKRYYDKGDLIIGDDVDTFFQLFKGYLDHQGITFVKVDNQAILDDSSTAHLLTPYQMAVQKSFQSLEMIYCMCHSPLIFSSLFQNKQDPFFLRNTDDYFPDELRSHMWHIYSNSMNALFSSVFPFAIPDWDMFQSYGLFSMYHAAARIISGGPVYLSDEPNKTCLDVVKKLVVNSASNTYVLRPIALAIPSVSSLFHANHGVKVVNFNRCNAVVGVFQTEAILEKKPIYAVLSPEDVVNKGILNHFRHQNSKEKSYLDTYPDPPNTILWQDLEHADKFAIFSFQSQMAVVMSRQQQLFLPLQEPNSFNIYTVAPFIYCKKVSLYVACLGLINKVNGGCSVIKAEISPEEQSSRDLNQYIISFHCWALGRIAFLIEPKGDSFHFGKNINFRFEVNHTLNPHYWKGNLLILDSQEQVASNNSSFVVSIYIINKRRTF